MFGSLRGLEYITLVEALRIITDPNLVVGKEAALRNLPSATEVASALQRLDAVALAPEQLAVLKEHACPAAAQVAQLQELMKENPQVPLALPEEYMWQISRVPAFQARVELPCGMKITLSSSLGGSDLLLELPLDLQGLREVDLSVV